MGRLTPLISARQACLGIVALVALSLAGPAAAQDADLQRAKELFENGVMLYDEGSYEAAVAAFREAYALSNEPLMLYNMASALERMGRWEEALEALNGYRAYAPSDEREVLERRIRSIEQRLEERGTGTNEPPPQPAPEPRKRVNPVAAALIGTGAVGVGVGTAFTLRAMGARTEWKAQCVEQGGGLLCPDGAGPLVSRDRTSGLIADVAWGVGLVSLGGGVVVSLGGRKGRASDQASTTLTVAPGAVTLGGRW